ncbi:MAG TPA: FAD-binding oxidoreductase [Bacteroidales bacterium]|nr:FAD-binding oxidoreductase [Bacteroidales bacterium]
MKPAKPNLVFSTVHLSANVEIAPNVHLLRMDKPFAFKAGQVIGIRLDAGQPHRLYSIASGEQEDKLEVLFDINPEGLLTPSLAKLRPGDALEISTPFGFFLNSPGPACWIATGTGIAPFRSMFRTGPYENKTLIHGARNARMFFFQDDFQSVLGQYYIRCSSRGVISDGYNGRLTQYLSEKKDLSPETTYMLCGNAEMVVEVRDLLISRGIPFGQIRAEIYF